MGVKFGREKCACVQLSGKSWNGTKCKQKDVYAMTDWQTNTKLISRILNHVQIQENSNTDYILILRLGVGLYQDNRYDDETWFLPIMHKMLMFHSFIYTS